MKGGYQRQEEEIKKTSSHQLFSTLIFFHYSVRYFIVARSFFVVHKNFANHVYNN